jgi:hypothetical protein
VSPPDALEVNPYAVTLLNAGAISWRETDVPLHARGVRFGWLMNFVRSLYWEVNAPRQKRHQEQLVAAEQAEYQRRAALYGPWDNIPEPDPVHVDEFELFELTTRDLVARHIVPVTSSAAAPLYALVPPSERGRPGVFLSHAWSNAIWAAGPGRYGTLNAFGKGVAGVDAEYVWIDIVCYNQHTLAEGNIAFDMESIVKSIGKVAFAVTPTKLFDRIWCLWEVLAAARTGSKLQFCAAPGYRTEKRMIVNDFFSSFSSVTQAKATMDRDYDILLSAMISYFGAAEAADAYIKEVMKREMSNPWFELYAENR